MIRGSPIQTNNTLFIGDLSVFAEDSELYQMFEKYGQIIEVCVKEQATGMGQKRKMGYGFIQFAEYDDAVRALWEMNGVVYKGRPMRIGWSCKAKHMQEPMLPERAPSVQVLVSFRSKNRNLMITEELLRSVFERFGKVEDATIKKTKIDPETQHQGGYGFVHFEGGDVGIDSALYVIESLGNFVVDKVTYDCQLSDTLRELLQRYPRRPIAPLDHRPDQYQYQYQYQLQSGQPEGNKKFRSRFRGSRGGSHLRRERGSHHAAATADGGVGGADGSAAYTGAGGVGEASGTDGSVTGSQEEGGGSVESLRHDEGDGTSLSSKVGSTSETDGGSVQKKTCTEGEHQQDAVSTGSVGATAVTNANKKPPAGKAAPYMQAGRPTSGPSGASGSYAASMPYPQAYPQPPHYSQAPPVPVSAQAQHSVYAQPRGGGTAGDHGGYPRGPQPYPHPPPPQHQHPNYSDPYYAHQQHREPPRGYYDYQTPSQHGQAYPPPPLPPAAGPARHVYQQQQQYHQQQYHQQHYQGSGSEYEPNSSTHAGHAGHAGHTGQRRYDYPPQDPYYPRDPRYGHDPHHPPDPYHPRDPHQPADPYHPPDPLTHPDPRNGHSPHHHPPDPYYRSDPRTHPDPRYGHSPHHHPPDPYYRSDPRTHPDPHHHPAPRYGSEPYYSCSDPRYQSGQRNLPHLQYPQGGPSNGPKSHASYTPNVYPAAPREPEGQQRSPPHSGQMNPIPPHHGYPHDDTHYAPAPADPSADLRAPARAPVPTRTTASEHLRGTGSGASEGGGLFDKGTYFGDSFSQPYTAGKQAAVNSGTRTVGAGTMGHHVFDQPDDYFLPKSLAAAGAATAPVFSTASTSPTYSAFNDYLQPQSDLVTSSLTAAAATTTPSAATSAADWSVESTDSAFRSLRISAPVDAASGHPSQPPGL